MLGVYDGATDVINRAYGRTDNLNLTNIWDNVGTGNNQSYWYNPANRLQNANGPWGDKTFYYDGVGNRTHENTTVSGVTTSDVYDYSGGSNRLDEVLRAGSVVRAITHDDAGNIQTDTRSGVPYAYAYNNAGRLKTVTVSGSLHGTYTYNGFEQLISRVVTNSGSANGTTHYVHDLWGNVIAELDATGATVREYIYLPEAEIAPTRGSRTQVDRPIAVIDAVNTATPQTLMVHVDHLNRPMMMTDTAKASVWAAEYTPWGAFHSATGAQTLNARFPGQWFQLEAGLHYNWHRHYDPSLGRYTQPDPLGFVDGPSVYAYAMGSPYAYVDKDGRIVWLPYVIGGAIGVGIEYFTNPCATFEDYLIAGALGAVGGGAVTAERGTIKQLFRNFLRDESGAASPGQISKYLKQLAQNGRNSLEKSERSIQRRLDEHIDKLQRYTSEGGRTSSVEREIRNFRNELEAIRRVLGK